MTNQEAFDKVYAHLKAQDTASINTDRTQSCAYISGDRTNHCAVGCLLPDDVCAALDELPNTGWSFIFRGKQDAAKQAVAILADVNTELLSSLQSVHDSTSRITNKATRWKAMEQLLRTTARSFGLKVPE